MSVKIIVLLYLLIFVKKTEQKKRYRTTIHPYISTIQTYFFEGVDYDFTNEEAKADHTNCFTLYHRCTRSRVGLQPICAIDTVGWWIEDFENACVLELYNCRHIVGNLKQPFYGVDFTSDRLYYFGYPIDCTTFYSYSRRQARDPSDEQAIKNYLGDKYEEMRAYHDKMVRLGYYKDVKRINKDEILKGINDYRP